MNLAGSSLLYSRLSLEDACKRLTAAGFDHVDVGVLEGWAHVDPSDIVGDVDSVAERIGTACRNADLQPVAMNVSGGDVDLTTEVTRIQAVAAAAEILDVDVLTLPAASTDTDLESDFDRFRALVAAIEDRDATLTVETHWGTHTEDPETAAQYSMMVPGLGYTLDPGHFAIGPHWHQDPYDRLLEDIKHVHVRQAGSGWEAIQQPVEAGRIDIRKFVADLRAAGYERAISVEYIDSLDGVDPDEAERHAVAMRDALEPLL